MSPFRRRREKAQLSAHTAEIGADFQQPFDLGITPEDIGAYLDSCSVGHPHTTVLPESLRRKLEKSHRRTSREIGRWVLGVSQSASKAIEVPDDPLALSHAYYLYLDMLKAKKALKSRIVVPVSVLGALAPDVTTRPGVTELADDAHAHVPLLPECAQSILTASTCPSQRLISEAQSRSPFKAHDIHLVAAGVGLAYRHAAYIVRQRAAITEDYKPTGE